MHSNHSIEIFDDSYGRCRVTVSNPTMQGGDLISSSIVFYSRGSAMIYLLQQYAEPINNDLVLYDNSIYQCIEAVYA